MKIRITYAIIAFVFVSIVSGQRLMWNQGETFSQGIKYGFLYVISGCGIPQAIAGDPEVFRLTVMVQFGFALFTYFATPIVRINRD